MLSKESFTESHIRALQKSSKRDPALLERAVYAFGLLEALARVGMPFIFKGGTSLMLLLEHPMRLSTDIDIIVEPGIPVDEFIKKASVIFPFVRFEEQKRIGKNMIDKRHFKFTYYSPVSGREFHIWLDVVFGENQYANLEELQIRNEILITEPEYLVVRVPGIDCILGDKLTAFAPHTTGIPLNVGKDMEVMKQFYDICTLLDVFVDFDKVSMTYKKIASTEIAYRGMEIDIREALEDTFCAAACIASRGKIKGEEYHLYLKGVRDLRGHIYADNFTPEIAAVRAAKVMYIVICLITGMEYTRVNDFRKYIEMKLTQESIMPLRYLRKVNPESYAYIVKTDQMIGLNITKN